MNSLFPVRELKRTEFLERKQMEGKKERNKERVSMCCCCKQDSQVNESRTHRSPSDLESESTWLLSALGHLRKRDGEKCFRGLCTVLWPRVCQSTYAFLIVTTIDFPDINAKNSGWKGWGKRTWCKMEKRQGLEGTVGRETSSWTSQGALTNTNASSPCTLLMSRRILVCSF